MVREETATTSAPSEKGAKREPEEAVEEKYPTLEEEGISVSQAFREAIFLSPEGILMMSAAIFADLSEVLVEVFLPGPGHIISVIIDIGAIIFIGGWMLFRSMIKRREMGETPPPLWKRRKVMKERGIEAVGRAAQKAAKWGRRLKWLLPLLVVAEMIPVLGSIPGWTVAVYLELKYG